MPEKEHPDHSSLASLADALQAEGRYTFDRDEAMAALQVHSRALKKSVRRLAAKRRIAVPRSGFYVIVPLEYRAAGAPPPSWFIDDLMSHLNKSYYVGLLSAAAIHGAAHQQPQEFQVVTGITLRQMKAGRSRIRFLGKRRHDRTLIADVKTETGSMKVSTPEATAIDLLRYASSAGGFGNVATVLAELAERIDPGRLAQAAAIEGGLSHAQRLGYILDLVGAGDRGAALAQLIDARKPRSVPLRPGRPGKGHVIDRRWRIIVNESIEADL